MDCRVQTPAECLDLCHNTTTNTINTTNTTTTNTPSLFAIQYNQGVGGIQRQSSVPERT
jgi:hypothetical protein